MLPLKVLLTVDTELWPAMPGWPHSPLAPEDRCDWEIRAYFQGETREDSYGVPYQLRMLRDHGLKAVYFIEPLFSFALGLDPLRELVAQVQRHGQEVGLHLHPEWLTDTRCKNLPPFSGPLLASYSRDAQRQLIKSGLDRLREAGAGTVKAFRAGSWGANQATLDALADNGLLMDTSLNAAFQQSLPDLPNRQTLQSPTLCGRVSEFPVTHFLDGSRREIRPLHVTACSFDEFRFVVDSSIAQGRSTLVVVFHSFEFVRVSRLSRGRLTTPQRLLMRRFGQMCRYLAARGDALETCHFRDLALPDFHMPDTAAPIRSSRTRTALRIAQQALSHVY